MTSSCHGVLLIFQIPATCLTHPMNRLDVLLLSSIFSSVAAFRIGPEASGECGRVLKNAAGKTVACDADRWRMVSDDCA
jgi:hypothetical protein